jgi:hypothetical protein
MQRQGDKISDFGPYSTAETAQTKKLGTHVIDNSDVSRVSLSHHNYREWVVETRWIEIGCPPLSLPNESPVRARNGNFRCRDWAPKPAYLPRLCVHQNRLIPIAYAVYDFLLSYATRAVSVPRCDQAVTDLREPPACFTQEPRRLSPCRQTIGPNGSHPREFSFTPVWGDGGALLARKGPRKLRIEITGFHNGYHSPAQLLRKRCRAHLPKFAKTDCLECDIRPILGLV